LFHQLHSCDPGRYGYRASEELFAVSAFALSACQRAPLAKSQPLDVEKVVSHSGKRRCHEQNVTALCAMCFDREIAMGRRCENDRGRI